MTWSNRPAIVSVKCKTCPAQWTSLTWKADGEEEVQALQWVPGGFVSIISGVSGPRLREEVRGDWTLVKPRTSSGGGKNGNREKSLAHCWVLRWELSWDEKSLGGIINSNMPTWCILENPRTPHRTGLQTRPPLINTKDETENQNSLDRRKNISLFSEFLVPGGLNYITCFTFKNLQSINIPDESDLFHKKLY